MVWSGVTKECTNTRSTSIKVLQQSTGCLFINSLLNKYIINILLILNIVTVKMRKLNK